MKVRSRNSSVV